MSGMSSSSRRSPVRGVQITPEVWRTKNAMFSGVAASAAMIRSPSFSRSSSSTTTTMSPRAMAATASSMDAKAELPEPCSESGSRLMLPSLWKGAVRVRAPGGGRVVGEMSGEQALGVLGHHVDLEVDGVARLPHTERGDLRGVGDDGHGEAVLEDVDDGERDPVDGDRALLDHVAEQARGDPHLHLGHRS